MELHHLGFMALLMISMTYSSVVAAPSEEGVENNSSIASAINELGFNIAREIQDSGNMFFSPVGLSMALGMAYLGAGGRTAEEMEQALGFKARNISGNEVHEGIRQLHANLTGPINGEHILYISNGFFSQLGLDIRHSFRDNIQAFYDGFAEFLDFANQPEEAKDSINKWASERTLGMIESFLQAPLPMDTQVLLVNALYFKGTWKIQFPVENTHDGYFYVDGGSGDLIVPMMSLASETFPYLVDKESGYKYLEMPYKGDEVSVLFALPIQYDHPANLIMTQKLLCTVMSSMRSTKLQTVAIPKFKLEYEKSMKNALKAMGIKDAFGTAANFSDIINGVYISDVLQKAAIEMNEQGSEAAAVSGILIMPVSFRPVEEFIANRPFLFYIVHKKTGVVLFAGKIVTP